MGRTSDVKPDFNPAVTTLSPQIIEPTFILTTHLIGKDDSLEVRKRLGILDKNWQILEQPLCTIGNALVIDTHIGGDPMVLKVLIGRVWRDDREISHAPSRPVMINVSKVTGHWAQSCSTPEVVDNAEAPILIFTSLVTWILLVGVGGEANVYYRSLFFRRSQCISSGRLGVIS